MADHHIRHLLITDDGEQVGFVTVDDLIAKPTFWTHFLRYDSLSIEQVADSSSIPPITPKWTAWHACRAVLGFYRYPQRVKLDQLGLGIGSID